MRPARSTIVLLAVLLANAAALLFFRFFITVDGPVHVLHAAVLEAPWATPDHLAHGITYDSNALHGWLGDRILMILLLFLAPERAHDLFAALVNCAVVLSVVAFLRAHGTRTGLAILWLAPIMFSVVLIMGLLHFLLGVAIAFGSVAWWASRARSPRSRWVGLLIGATVAWYTHRSAPSLLCALFLPMLLIELVNERAAVAHGERRSMVWRIVFASVLVMAGTFPLAHAVRRIPLRIPGDLPDLREAFLLRPLLLLDQAKEQWLVHSIGVLLVISIAAGVWARWRMGRKVLWHDLFLALFLLLALAAWLYDTPHGHQLLITERAQWLALVMLAVWLIAIADAHRGRVAPVIGGAALCALPLHVIRLVQAEESLSHMEQAHDSTMEASDALAPNSLVVPVMAEHDRMLQHLVAYVTIDHDGVVLAPDERIAIVEPSVETGIGQRLRIAQDRSWLVRHWRKGIPQEVDQVLFIGNGIERVTNTHPWSVLLAERYRITFDNGYTRIYTAAPDSAR